MSFDKFMVANDTAANPKVKRLKRAGKETRWAWFHGVLAIAAKATMRGYFAIGDIPADEHDVADVADVTVAEARKALAVARELGMLVRDDELGLEHVHDWDDFNPAPRRKDPTNAERQARFRAKRKAENGACRNADNAVTPQPVTAGNEGEVEVEGEVEEQQQGGTRAGGPARTPVTGLHPRLGDVLAILQAAPGLDVEDMAVNSAITSRSDSDPVANAHTVAGWAHDGDLVVKSAARLLRSAAKNAANELARQDGIREAAAKSEAARGTARTTSPPRPGRGGGRRQGFTDQDLIDAAEELKAG